MDENTFEFKDDGLYINDVKINFWDNLKIESGIDIRTTKLTISIYGNLHGVDDLPPYDFAKPDE